MISRRVPIIPAKELKRASCSHGLYCSELSSRAWPRLALRRFCLSKREQRTPSTAPRPPACTETAPTVHVACTTCESRACQTRQPESDGRFRAQHGTTCEHQMHHPDKRLTLCKCQTTVAACDKAAKGDCGILRHFYQTRYTKSASHCRKCHPLKRMEWADRRSGSCPQTQSSSPGTW